VQLDMDVSEQLKSLGFTSNETKALGTSLAMSADKLEQALLEIVGASDRTDEYLKLILTGNTLAPSYRRRTGSNKSEFDSGGTKKAIYTSYGALTNLL